MCSADRNETTRDKHVFQDSKGPHVGSLWGSQAPGEKDGEDCRMPSAHSIIDNFSYRSIRSTHVITRTRGFLLTDMREEVDQNNCTILIADSEKPPLLSRSPFLHIPSK